MADLAELYWKRGYVRGIRVMAAECAAAFAARIEEHIDAQPAGAAPPGQIESAAIDRHPLGVLFRELATWPALLDAVEAVLGPDLLIRNADLFVKDPGHQENGIEWHLDSAATGPDTDGMLSAFVALTPATLRSGCLQFSAGTHRRVLDDPPRDKYHLTLSQRAASSLRFANRRPCPLAPGELSLHHVRTAHRSRYNRAGWRRIGFVVRFVASWVDPEIAETGVAMLARGTCPDGRYELRERFPVSWN